MIPPLKKREDCQQFISRDENPGEHLGFFLLYQKPSVQETRSFSPFISESIHPSRRPSHFLFYIRSHPSRRPGHFLLSFQKALLSGTGQSPFFSFRKVHEKGDLGIGGLSSRIIRKYMFYNEIIFISSCALQSWEVRIKRRKPLIILNPFFLDGIGAVAGSCPVLLLLSKHCPGLLPTL